MRHAVPPQKSLAEQVETVEPIESTNVTEEVNLSHLSGTSDAGGGTIPADPSLKREQQGVSDVHFTEDTTENQGDAASFQKYLSDYPGRVVHFQLVISTSQNLCVNHGLFHVFCAYTWVILLQ